jgi:hypothetical protein
MAVAAVFAADTHISEKTWASRSALQGDSFFGFDQICGLATKYKVPLLVAGDCWELVHEPRPSSETVKHLRDRLDMLADSGCPFYYVNGQHDKLQQPDWFQAIHSHPRHVGNRRFEVAGEKWYGVDFFESIHSQAVYKEIPRDIDGILIHQRWQEFAGAAHFASETLGSLSGVSRIVSGDMHKLIVNASSLSDSYQISPGSTHMRSLSEPEEHYAILFDPDLPTGQRFYPHKLKSRPVHRISVTDELEFIDKIDDYRKLFEEQHKLLWDAGYSEPVARPLVIVEDQVSCDAAKLLQRGCDVAHVVSRATRSKQSAVDVFQAEVLESGALEELALQTARQRDLRGAPLRLLESLLAGDDLLEAAMGLSEGVSNAEEGTSV